MVAPVFGRPPEQSARSLRSSAQKDEAARQHAVLPAFLGKLAGKFRLRRRSDRCAIWASSGSFRQAIWPATTARRVNTPYFYGVVANVVGGVFKTLAVPR